MPSAPLLQLKPSHTASRDAPSPSLFIPRATASRHCITRTGRSQKAPTSGRGPFQSPCARAHRAPVSKSRARIDDHPTDHRSVCTPGMARKVRTQPTQNQPSDHSVNQQASSTSRRPEPSVDHRSTCVSAIQDTAARSAAGLPQGSGGVSVCPAGTHLSSICGPHAFSVGTQHARNSQPRQAIRSHTARGDDQRPCLPQGTGGVVSPPDRHAAGTSRVPHAEVTRASWPPPPHTPIAEPDVRPRPTAVRPLVPWYYYTIVGKVVRSLSGLTSLSGRTE